MTANIHLSVRKPRIFLWSAGVLVAAGIAAGVAVTSTDGDAAGPAPQGAPPAVPVSVATVEATKTIRWHEFSGRLEAVERVEIRSRVAGQIQDVLFREGSLVEQGDLLVTIDPAPFEAEVARAEAAVASARAQLKFTKVEHERAQKLAGTGAMPVREMDRRDNDYREAQAALRAQQALLRVARLNLGYTEIRAPISGRVGKALITVGNLVPAGAGAPALTTLVSVDPIYAAFDADEKVVMQQLHELRKSGSNLDVSRIPVEMEGAAADEPVIHGQVQFVDNAVDAASGTVRVRAQFPNPDGFLMPGQFARLRMGQASPQPLLLISERAIGTDLDKKFVMVVGEGDKAEYREVTLGAVADGLRIVTSGLNAGDRVIVSGLQRVRPGAQVKPEAVSMRPANAAEIAENQ
ncbi:MAG: efflux RND transporter periplasmic adaptor subunit [Rhodospirillales bacterium]|nr:efflux RND transporter periplasmic adaptor subunit [Rhodospirillales bacterium]MBO6788478.1 efflux RND transporter periplasmic adaptor subunit [Rhodospirillales bacterium]